MSDPMALRPRLLDLFSGIGAFSLGLKRAGMRTVAFCETDPFCRRVLAHHWPEVPILGDITAVPEFPAADVVCGGFPCQDLSRAGKRAGLAGQRSGLYRELVRAVRLVRPRHAIVENVAALVGDGLDVVLGDLAESGYDAEWDCVPAGAIGAPHQRDRVWIVAHAEGEQERTSRQSRVNDGVGQNSPDANDRCEQADEKICAGRYASEPCAKPPANSARADDGRCDGSAAGGQEREPGGRAGETVTADADCFGRWDRAGRRDWPEVGDSAEQGGTADTASVGCRQGRTRRPPDSFAWIRDATRWNTGHAYRAGLAEREGERGDARQEREAAERAAIGDVWQSRWPCEPALLGMDDGCADRVDRTAASGIR